MIFDSIPPSVDEILKDQVYISNLSAAESDETKKKLGITHILSVCPEYASTGTDHLVVPVDDSEYDDLLIHLSDTCCFIEDALARGGRVLVHCVMGVSRSTTVVAAYLMKTMSLTPAAAISFIKKHRPRVQPNYGFLKQLDTFLECGYAPTPTHPAYIKWKRRHQQDCTNFLNQLIDTVVIIPDELLLSSEFPDDAYQAEILLAESGVTHLLSLSPAQTASVPMDVHHRRIDIPAHAPDDLLLALPDACAFICGALDSGGKVLVHSLLEARACTVVGAYPPLNFRLVRKRTDVHFLAFFFGCPALPLFDATPNFTRYLKLFQACKYKPTSGDLALAAHGDCVAWGSASVHPRSQFTENSLNSHATKSEAFPDADLMTRTAASVMSETGIDMLAFGNTLVTIQQNALAHTASTTA
ncbi:protein-tyrosine phosphatase-like protein [Mycena maculata]|uniref:protein-tyrosine-phosphatase n=1 Tax=Mycena maculata TaxID=230809 RepID=A0AAD7K5H9_9AGAR|nr:protein-tyrosine phosphatase-like protein [Mycena maculata]